MLWSWLGWFSWLLTNIPEVQHRETIYTMDFQFVSINGADNKNHCCFFKELCKPETGEDKLRVMFLRSVKIPVNFRAQTKTFFCKLQDFVIVLD